MPLKELLQRLFRESSKPSEPVQICLGDFYITENSDQSYSHLCIRIKPSSYGKNHEFISIAEKIYDSPYHQQFTSGGEACSQTDPVNGVRMATNEDLILILGQLKKDKNSKYYFEPWIESVVEVFESPVKEKVQQRLNYCLSKLE